MFCSFTNFERKFIFCKFVKKKKEEEKEKKREKGLIYVLLVIPRSSLRASYLLHNYITPKKNILICNVNIQSHFTRFKLL